VDARRDDGRYAMSLAGKSRKLAGGANR